MRLTYDSTKRDMAFRERGLDFDDALKIFDGDVFEFLDKRRDYGEQRMITVGFLRGRMMMVVWTQRGDFRHIISMRKANDREQIRYGDAVGRSG